MKYQKLNPGETQVFDDSGSLVGSIKRETPPPGVPAPWVYRFWPAGITSITQASSAFPSMDLIKAKLPF